MDEVDEDSRLLLGMGTAICGGSAIATAAPIIDAEDDAIAMSLTTVFWYNLLALFVFPFLGELLHYSALQFGIFAGAAINDTSSVVAAGFEHSDVAGDIATITKLVRTVIIVPVSLILLLWQIRRSVVHSNQKISFKVVIRLVPSFIYGFLASILLATLLPLPETFVTGIKDLSKIIMTAALVAIGLTIEGSQFKKAGFRPILLGGITWSAVILVAILLIHIFY